jgi:hypothetical protein
MIIAESRFGSPVGALADGTPFYAPIGEVIVDASLVICHLCGRSLRSVTGAGDPQAPCRRAGFPPGL